MLIPPEPRSIAELALGDFCRHHSADAIADRIRYRYEFVDTSAVLVEQRPGFMNPEEWASRPVAKFRYSPGKDQWSLYWADAHEKWRRLSNAPADKDIRKLLKIVEDDPSGVFTK